MVNTFYAYTAQRLEAGGSETVLYLDRITTVTGETIVSADFATFSRGIATINPDGTTDNPPEWASFTAVDGSAISLTGVTRGLSAKGNSVVAGNKRYHPVGTPVTITFGVHNIQDIIDYVDTEVGAVTVGSAGVTTGTAGEDLADGNSVYLRVSDSKWWKADASTSATCEGVQLGIAQGAASADGACTVLTSGRATNLSGLTPNSTYYISDTAGAISDSAGTVSKAIGVARTTTELYVEVNYSNLPSADERAAMAGGGEFGTPSATNKFVTDATRRVVLTAGETITGATTPVPVYQNKTDNEFYICDANDTGKMKFLGFAVSNGADGGALTVQFTGVVSGFTGLSEGEKYYVSDTAGTISTTMGTYEVLVGVAISETQLFIQKGRRYATGYGTITSASGSSVVTCGFRVSKLTYYAGKGTTSAVHNFSVGVWVNGAMAGGLSVRPDETYAFGSVISEVSTSSDKYSISLSDVTDTGFTLNWSETGSMGDYGLFWVAEGEL